MPVRNACYFVHQACLGLKHAYDEGMVHGDIKPGNLMLTIKAGRLIVEVLDFGLAKAGREQRVLELVPDGAGSRVEYGRRPDVRGSDARHSRLHRP